MTAWHPAYSTATAQAENATRIVLGPTGRIEGLLDLQDGAELELRPARTTLVQAGHFAFADLPAGTYGLFLPDRTVYALTVSPAETLHFSRERAFDARIAITSGGRPWVEEFEGALVGLGPVASLATLELRGGTGLARGVLPGQHLLVAFRGPTARVSVTGPSLQIELGAAALTVQGPPDHTLMLLPAELIEHSFARTMAERVSRADSTGVQHLGPLAAGVWVVEDLTDGTRTLVELSDTEQLVLDLH